MKKEHSAGAIVFRIEHGNPQYLLLHYPSSAKAKKEYWDLPKGHIEKGEEEQDTVRREIKEETGLKDIELFDGFREEIRYWFQFGGQKISKTVVFYLAKTRQENVVISSEHLGFQWLEFAEAQQKLTYKNAKQILKKAHHLLSQEGIL
ncbi:MAG: bis(5'-nucleosyl)-tetraphosphatase [Patescibacteria group bacterium]